MLLRKPCPQNEARLNFSSGQNKTRTTKKKQLWKTSSERRRSARRTFAPAAALHMSRRPCSVCLQGLFFFRHLFLFACLSRGVASVSRASFFFFVLQLGRPREAFARSYRVGVCVDRLFALLGSPCVTLRSTQRCLPGTRPISSPKVETKKKSSYLQTSNVLRKLVESFLPA